MAGRSPRESSNSAWPRPSPTGGRPRSRSSGQQRPPSVQLLHEFLRAEYGYERLLQVGPQVRAGPLRPSPDPPVPAGRDPTRGADPERLGRVPPGRSRRPRRTDDRLRLRHGPQPQPQGGRRLEPLDGPARLAPRPQRGLPPARRRGGGQPDRQPQDRASPTAAAPGDRSTSNIVYMLGRWVFTSMRARSARPNRRGRRSDASATARAWTSRAGASTAWAASSRGPTRIGRPVRCKRICPATGLSVAASWEAEKPFLRPLPELLPEPFDLVKTAPVHKDCMVHFEGRSYAVPFLYVGRDGGGPRLLGIACRSSIRRPPRC